MKAEILQYPATVIQIAVLLGIRHEEHDHTLASILSTYRELTKHLPNSHPDRVLSFISSEVVIDSYGKEMTIESVRILVNTLDRYKHYVRISSIPRIRKAMVRAFEKSGRL